jgi:hypothetical protein
MESLDSCSHTNHHSVEFSSDMVELIGKSLLESWYRATHEVVCTCLKNVFDSIIRPKLDHDLRRITARVKDCINAPSASAQIALVGTKSGSSIQLQPTSFTELFPKEPAR